MAKKQKVLGIQLDSDGVEMGSIDSAVSHVPLASKNGLARYALHLGFKQILNEDPGKVAQGMVEFGRLQPSDRFKK